MTKTYQENIEEQLNDILGIIRQFPQGATSEEIKIAAGLNIEVRTLQRRLEKLVQKGRLQQSGARRSAKYHLNEESAGVPIFLEDPEKGFNNLLLSRESRDILSILSKPIGQRHPVGYNRSLLDSYKPNVDFYLSPAERRQLATETSVILMPDQPAGTYARQILQRLLIDLSWNSSRLEGNTYSLLDTERLLDKGAAAPGKSAKETQMILNHKDAIEFLVSGGDEISFNRYTLLNLHALLADNLEGSGHMGWASAILFIRLLRYHNLSKKCLKAYWQKLH